MGDLGGRGQRHGECCNLQHMRTACLLAVPQHMPGGRQLVRGRAVWTAAAAARNTTHHFYCLSASNSNITTTTTTRNWQLTTTSIENRKHMLKGSKCGGGAAQQPFRALYFCTENRKKSCKTQKTRMRIEVAASNVAEVVATQAVAEAVAVAAGATASWTCCIRSSLAIFQSYFSFASLILFYFISFWFRFHAGGVAAVWLCTLSCLAHVESWQRYRSTRS